MTVLRKCDSIIHFFPKNTKRKCKILYNEIMILLYEKLLLLHNEIMIPSYINNTKNNKIMKKFHNRIMILVDH